MNYSLDKKSNKKLLRKYLEILFLLGIFFLPSSLLIGFIFLIPASIIGSFFNKKPFFKDPWNYSLIIFGIIILISTLLQNFFLNNMYSAIWNPTLSIIGMANWLPYIWLFWAVQPYIDSPLKRKLFGLVLIAGSFPVLITGFSQYFLNLHGPFQTLNGLIIWYQRPIDNPGGLSGLFNHQNYAGSWLNFVWPFCIALCIEKKDFVFNKIVNFGFLFSVGFATFLTYSRNAWIGLITSFLIIIGREYKKIILICITLLIILIFYLLSPLFESEIQKNIINIFPERLILEFSEKGYEGLDTTRQEIFLSGISLIKESPIFGIGAGSFSKIFEFETGFWKGHSHNLLLELAISYGLPSMIIFFTTINFIVFFSGKNIFFVNKFDSSLFDKAFWAAIFFFLFSQLFDIQYLDGKISLLLWILLAGLKNIIDESYPNSIQKDGSDY